MTYEDIKTIRNDRARIIDQMNKLVSLAHTEKRSMSPEETQQWEKMDADGEALRVRVEQAEKTLRAVDSLNHSDLPAELRGDRNGNPEPRFDLAGDEEQNGEPTRDVLDASIRSWIAFGMDEMPDDQRRVLRTVNQRAMSQASATGGGNLIPQNTSFYDQIVVATKELGLDEAGLFTVLNTDDTGDLPFPTNDDTAQSGSSMQENVDAGTATDLTINTATLYAHLNTTAGLYVSNKLLANAAAAPFIARQLGLRIARRRAAQLTTGTGSAGQVSGVVVGSTLGKSAAAQAAVTFSELLELKHAVDPSYRSNAKWMMHDSTWKALKQSVDSQGRPLYQPSFAMGSPATIDGDPIVINNNMATLATSAKTVLYGDFKNYYVRNAGGLIVRRSEERAVEKFQTLFIGFWMFDGRLLDTTAVKHLIQSS